MDFKKQLIYPLVAMLAFALCGIPEAVHAQEPAQQPAEQQQQGSQQEQQNPQQPIPGVSVDPSKGPLTPPVSTEPPTSEQPVTTPPEGPTPQTQVNQPAQQQGQREPLGAATAGSVRTEGGGASRPAGTAIAPAKQHQVRSFLIKFGAIAAAGVAIGTVYALSKGTSSVPPNSGR